MKTEQTKPSTTTALILTGLYLLFVISSCCVLLITSPDDSLAGKYLFMLTMPWSFFLNGLAGSLHIESPLLTMAFMLAGGLVNGLIIYKTASYLLSRKIFTTPELTKR